MRYYDTTFFVDKEDGIKVSITKSQSKEASPHPFVVTITKKSTIVVDRPAITLFMAEECLDMFLESIDAEALKLANEALDKSDASERFCTSCHRSFVKLGSPFTTCPKCTRRVE